MTKAALIIAGGVLVASAAIWAARRRGAEQGEDSFMDITLTAIDELAGAFTATPVANMVPSERLKEMLKKREALRLTRYELGDGGYTWGYGHFEKDANALPYRITKEKAEELFNSDIEQRAAKWVRLYVKVPLTQFQFDALVHIAYNLSPRGFKRFADRVNAGEGIEAIAAQSVNWPAAHLRNGIRNRRNEEIALFNWGTYA
jgi:lysozyme